MSRLVAGTLGDFSSAVAGTAVDVSSLTPGTVTVTMEISTSPAWTGTVVIEQSMDGSSWAPCTASTSTLTTTGCFVVPVAAKAIRASTATADGGAYSAGSAYLRYGGRQD